MPVQISCFKCQNQLTFPEKVGFREECPKCREDVHCCRNCEFYDPKVYNECRETSADVIREKDRANYCEYFRPRPLSGLSEAQKKQDLLSAAEALFKKKN